MTIRQFLAPLTLGVLSFSCAWAQQYTITTFAGNKTSGYSGDNGSATSAQLDLPLGLAFDASGNLYVADSYNHRVRKVSGGSITTFAGNGTAGYTGDKSAATSAELNHPSAVAVDSSGNVYIADTNNHVIRKVVPGGTITTVVGNNTSGYTGDGGAATSAELNSPTSIAFDSAGNLYIADSGNDVIRQVSVTNIITTIVGNTVQTEMNNPETVVVDSSNNLYISEQNGVRIVKFSLTSGTFTAIAGNGSKGFSGDNGPATQASLFDPTSIALDSKGYLYICDTLNSRIRKVSPDGIITTIAGVGIPAYGGDGGPATNAVLFFPHGIIVDATGNVYISDTVNYIVRVMKPVTPAITDGGVVNAANFTAAVSPGALASVFGSNFTGSGLSATAPSLPLASSLGGMSVQVNGRAAPVLYASETQINFQIPWEIQAGAATVTVSVNGLASAAVNITVLAAAPGLFVNGSHAAAQNSDYSLNSSSTPAKVGGTILAYLTGAGAVSPQPADGAAAPSGPLSMVIPSVSAAIGSQSAQVSFAGLAPGFAGLWQVNVVVPPGLARGDYPLTVSVGGQTSNAANVSVTP